MANPESPKGPSWRKQAAPAPIPPPPSSSPHVAPLPSGGGAGGWKGGPPPASSSVGDWFKSRKGKVITAIVLTGVAVALFIILVLALMPLHPACIVLIGAPAEDNL